MNRWGLNSPTKGLLVSTVLLTAGCAAGGRSAAPSQPNQSAEHLPAAPALAHSSRPPDAHEQLAAWSAAGDSFLPSGAVRLTVANEEAGSSNPTPAFSSTQIELAQPTNVLRSGTDAESVNSERVETHLRPEVVPIDLATALAISGGENPEVAFARQRINEAFARARAADVLWVPSLRAGVNYNKHEGTIQDVAGNMIETSRGSVYTGLGAQAVGASSPAVPGVVVEFHTRDMIYQPRIADQVLAATRQASRAVTNDILMETALAYNDLLEALELEAVAADTLANTRRLADVTGDYARSGQGLPSDADRAKAELATRQVEAQRAAENVQVASVRLARLLSQDPTATLAPLEPSIVPIDMAPLDRSLHELVAIGLSNRPELAESRYLICAAVERLRREQNAPLVPSVLLGLSYGGNGGGLGGDIDNFGDRLDFDAVAYWELRNLGLGEQAARDEARSRLQQARWRQVQVLDQVASEVAEAHAQVVARRQQIELAQAGIIAARESYRRNSERIQDAFGLPIEVLQSIQALDAAQRQYVRSVADYNRAQFRLPRALGWPIQ